MKIRFVKQSAVRTNRSLRSCHTHILSRLRILFSQEILLLRQHQPSGFLSDALSALELVYPMKIFVRTNALFLRH